MKVERRIFVAFLILLSVALLPARASDEIPELATALSLFSAHAGDDGIRVNWTLDRQSPTIVKFRVYRGYADAGHFAVLAELPSHGGQNDAHYAYTDTLAIPGVTYYYKLGAAGQSSESVFPVVISAAVQPAAGSVGSANDPVTLLPGKKLELYVREAGHVQLNLIAPAETQPIVDDELSPGIYELEPPANGSPLRLRVTHDNGFSRDLDWPLQ
jgi:hypothetical protein